MIFRIATEHDTAELLNIYSQYISTPTTFEYTLPSLAEFSFRIKNTLKDYPFLVCEESGTFLGYAYAHRIQTREAYQWGAELSIYLDHTVIARGIGTILYSLLIELLRHQGVRTVYGCVTMPNPRSKRLHEKLGFRIIGIFHRAGFKSGTWHDIMWFEKEIAGYNTPAPLTPFSEITAEKIRNIIDSATPIPST